MSGRIVNKKALKYGKIVLLLAISVISIKAVLFTGHLIVAGYHYRIDKKETATHMYSCFRLKPKTYKIFSKYNTAALDNLIVKTTIYKNNIDLLNDSGLDADDIAAIKNSFKDNIYLHRLLPQNEQTDTIFNWENPDTVSLEIMADQSMNTLTVSIFEKNAAHFYRRFIENLVDYCRWKKNTVLEDYLETTFKVQDASDNSGLERGCDYRRSIAHMNELLNRHFQLEPKDFGENMIKFPAFQQEEPAGDQWFLSRMANKEPFADGSFTMGVDKEKRGNNHFMRIMGFYAGSEEGKSNPRGGAWYKDKIPIKQGWYLLSFDYATKTGNESPSFWLWKWIGEKRLTTTEGKWHKVVYILDNSNNKYSHVKPLFRMWGTGTTVVDNIYLARIGKTQFSVKKTNRLVNQPTDPIQ